MFILKKQSAFSVITLLAFDAYNAIIIVYIEWRHMYQGIGQEQ